MDLGVECGKANLFPCTTQAKEGMVAKELMFFPQGVNREKLQFSVLQGSLSETRG